MYTFWALFGLIQGFLQYLFQLYDANTFIYRSCLMCETIKADNFMTGNCYLFLLHTIIHERQQPHREFVCQNNWNKYRIPSLFAGLRSL